MNASIATGKTVVWEYINTLSAYRPKIQFSQPRNRVRRVFKMSEKSRRISKENMYNYAEYWLLSKFLHVLLETKEPPGLF